MLKGYPNLSSPQLNKAKTSVLHKLEAVTIQNMKVYAQFHSSQTKTY